ncbi:hypothetical protein HAX54_048590, partial [Datura stramonium]|nr:hypothetical protein [Datura stramonium]
MCERYGICKILDFAFNVSEDAFGVISVTQATNRVSINSRDSTLNNMVCSSRDQRVLSSDRELGGALHIRHLH